MARADYLDALFALVATGIFGVPGDVILSTFITLASGLGYTINDNSLGSGINQRQILLNAGRPPETFN